MTITSGSPSTRQNPPSATRHPRIMRRTPPEDETHRGDDRPTLPHIRELFGRELSQPPHPNAPSAPVHHSPSSHLSQLTLLDDGAYRGDQGRSNYTPSHGHTQASGHGQQLRPLTTPYHTPSRAQPTSHAAPSPSSRTGYNPDSYNYNPEPSRGEATRGVYPHDPAPGAVQYSYPPPPPPPQQSYASGPTSRVPPAGYHQYARPMIPSYPSPGAVVPSGLPGLVGPDQPSATTAKYECTYCGKAFTRPSSLKIHVHSHTGERPFQCTHDGCNRTFSVQSNMRRHARTHLSPGNEARESEGEEGSEEGSPQPQAGEHEQGPPPR
ncbi:hypothetical protein BJV78DRAFT_1280426 [Lactifluus subvellereus]|nr:hypothetical protein BJV78DRAFT_1280426 [Lactifluus subvellereus]